MPPPMGMAAWYGWSSGPGANRRCLVHGPHRHSDEPVRLDDLLPHRRENNFAVWSSEVVVTLLHMRAEDVNLQEGLFDEILHALEYC